MLIMLSKDNCIYCKQFKSFLEFSPIGKNYKGEIKSLNRDHLETVEDKFHFNEVLEKAKTKGALSFPILLNSNGDLLMSGFDPTKAKNALMNND